MVAEHAFWAACALLFAASAALTIVWCGSMSSMGEMAMPGGWTMTMTWMRMPGQTWPGAAASFVGMWVVMMVAMMLPSVAPVLWRYRQAVDAGCAAADTDRTAVRRDRTAIDRDRAARLGGLTTLVGVGYFAVWTAIGAIVFPLGIALATIEMQHPAVSRVVPIAAGVAVLIAGALQFSAWKARHLACCREAPGRTLSADAGTALRLGLRLGRHCGHTCAGLMTILLILGVMDLRAMAIVTAAITVERLAPGGDRAARTLGVVIIAAGVLMIARAAGLA